MSMGIGRVAEIVARVRLGNLNACLVACLLNGCAAAPEEQDLASTQRDYRHPSAADAPSSTEPARDYTLFEVGPVRPVAVLQGSGMVVVTNTVDDYLEILRPGSHAGLTRCGAVKVGMRPVAVAVVSEQARSASLWVVNHLSDSVSVVELDLRTCRGEVSRTLHVGDEPRDIVLGHTRAGEPRVMVSTAHRGQRHAVPSARSGADLVAAPEEKTERGLADVFVFDPGAPQAPLQVVNLFSDTPRALAVGQGVVYAAGFHTGNRTTAVLGETVVARGLAGVHALLARDAAGLPIEEAGELRLLYGTRGVLEMVGGNPAVAGSGRCVPDPRQRGFESLQGLCVETDAQNRALRVVVQREGKVDPSCQCTSGDGTLQPMTSVIVKFFDTERDCGARFARFPDGTRGCWLDAAPGGVATPAHARERQAPPMAWNDQVRLSLPDQDVFAIDMETLTSTRAFAGVGTILFNMAVQPRTGRVYVSNTDAQNLTRFEGRGQSSSTSVIGHLHESRITSIDPVAGTVRPVHLNPHIDYSRCCEKDPEENARSLAFPTGLEFSKNGEQLFFTALGSDQLAVANVRALDAGLERPGRDLRQLDLRRGSGEASGPVGLALDHARGKVYVKTHFTNELLVVDAAALRVTQRVALPTPEPESITDGRPVLYDARGTSAHGDSACASCHVFGDFDSLSWDLGDPDGVTVKNPGPFATPVELLALGSIALDPFGQDPANRPQTPDFRSNKGPMSTQTLRGLANQGPQHWRGDRTRRAQAEPGRQPDFGSLDEASSFGEFDVAIQGLNGNDVSLDPDQFEKLTRFTLQVSLPPNPIRALDNSLDAAQQRARATYFGCASMTDAQFDARECQAMDGSRVNVDQATQDCFCQINPLLDTLRSMPQIQGFAALLQAILADAGLREAWLTLARDTSGLPQDQAARALGLSRELASHLGQLLTADLARDQLGVFSFDAGGAIAGTSGSVLGLLQLSSSFETATGGALLDLLIAALPAAGLPVDSPLLDAGGLTATFGAAFGASNLGLRVLADELSRGTSEFRDLLGGCDPEAQPVCRLRVTDVFDTCHGCHTLDPRGNAGFGVYRPGFFGTSGEYSFEKESQMFKVPQLRNVYQKVGMFGMPQSSVSVPESSLGVRAGGFFATENRFMGAQVRGFGMLHDGAFDTLHRFHGAEVFKRSAPGSAIDAPGTRDGFSSELPADDTRAQCLALLRSAPPGALDQLSGEGRANLEFCPSASPIPDSCFLDPLGAACKTALAQLADERGEPGFAERFSTQILPLCFQLGSALEGGTRDGACFPEGLRERAELESFMLAFDSNLKPMVGQQVTWTGDHEGRAELAALLRAAASGHCDAALRQGNRGFLVTGPAGSAPERSVLTSRSGAQSSLGSLVASHSAKRLPITVTCYPPQPGQAEARRSAFDR